MVRRSLSESCEPCCDDRLLTADRIDEGLVAHEPVFVTVAAVVERLVEQALRCWKQGGTIISNCKRCSFGRGVPAGVYSGGHDNSDCTWSGGYRFRGLDYSCSGMSHSEEGGRCAATPKFQERSPDSASLEERRCLSSGAEAD